MQVYPDEDHFMSGAKNHLFGSVSNFLKNCLKKDLVPIEDEEGNQELMMMDQVR